MLKMLPAVVALSALVFAGAASAGEVTKSGVTVVNAWARATPGGSTVGAAFMEIKTDATTADKLVGVASPVAASPEIHTHIMDGDVMKMRRIDSIDLKPGEDHMLKPMGDHIMLIDLKQPLKEGDVVKLTLTFEKAGPIDVDAVVAGPGAIAPPTVH